MRFLGLHGGKDGTFQKKALSVKDGAGRLPLTICLLFFAATTVWILFEHEYLGLWDPITKDIFWAVLSTGILYFLLRYGVSAIRKADAALKDSEEIRSRILETSASGFLVVNPEGEVTYANLKAGDLLGVSREDLIGRNYRDLSWERPLANGKPFPQEDHPFLRAEDAGEGRHGVELAVRRPDGSRVILSINTAPLRDRRGNVAGRIASFFDVTAQREEEDLQFRKLYLAIEQNPTAIAITDVAGRIEYANPTFVHLTGYPLEMLLETQKPCPTDLSPHECRQIRDAFASGSEWKGDYWNRRGNGELYWESAALTPIRNAMDQITHFLWVVEDITEKHLAEEALRESREQYQNLVEKIHDLVWETDPEAVFTYVNPRIRDLLGYETEEVLGKTPFDLMPGEEAQRVRSLIAPVLAGRRKFEHVESIHLRKDGRHVTWTTSGVPFFDADGSFRGWRGVSRDITARVRAEEEAKSRQVQLIHANRMASLGTMVSGFAHEINNPNNLIMFNAPMILQAWKDAEGILEKYRREHGDFPLGGLPYSEMREAVPKLVQGISESSYRIRNFVEDLKEFARPASRNPDCDVNVHQTIRSAVRILNHEIEKGCSNFRVDRGPDSLMVRGCSRELEQVLINLIHNSLQSLPDRNCAIRISAAQDEASGFVEIAVRDEGRGMSREILKYLTKPFFSTRQETGGLGLGLSISRSIVERHGGELRFESEVGKGTTARILLPGQGARSDVASGASSPGSP